MHYFLFHQSIVIRSFYLLLLLVTLQCSQIQSFQALNPIEPLPSGNFEYPSEHRKDKKTVVILADSEGSEITDLIVPYSLLKEAGLNVYILSNKKSPVQVWKGLVLLPHFYIEEFSLQYDAIVVPNVFHPEDKLFQKFLKNQSVPVLSVCEGAKVISESKSFDNYKLTTHATSFSQLENEYPNMQWTRGQKYIVDRNLISTAGVSSSIEGSLVLIEKLTDSQISDSIKNKIHYPYPKLKETYSAESISFADQLSILWKVSFDGEPRFIMPLEDGMNELDIALAIDVWTRTFPSSISTTSNSVIRTKNGLLLYGNRNSTPKTTTLCFAPCESDYETQIRINEPGKFTLDVNLEEVRKRYGDRFQKVVRRLMDY